MGRYVETETANSRSFESSYSNGKVSGVPTASYNRKGKKTQKGQLEKRTPQNRQ